MSLPPAPEPPAPAWVFLSEAPPLREDAAGNHGIAANFIDIFGGSFERVFTRRLRRAVTSARVRAWFKTPIDFYLDATPFGIRRVSAGMAAVADVVLALLWLTLRPGALRHLKSGRLFVLVGAEGWFLFVVIWFHRRSGLPLDIYLVDDLEESARLCNRFYLKRIIAPLERWSLRAADRVFAISPGYAEHLTAKYGVKAAWLPSPMQIERFEHQAFQLPPDGVRKIVFVGNVSYLYASALIEVLEAIRDWNGIHLENPIVLETITFSQPALLLERTDLLPFIRPVIKPPKAELERRCKAAWAILLPYSFEPEVKTLVSTSFSWKLSDAYSAGRPILVYGPPYASIPRYFKEAGLPLCACSKIELRNALEKIELIDAPELIASYQKVWQRFHSPKAVRGFLQLPR